MKELLIKASPFILGSMAGCLLGGILTSFDYALAVFITLNTIVFTILVIKYAE